MMHCIVMPTGRDSEISYRVKCVAVESERVFGDVVVTQQTRNRLYWMNTSHYPDVSRMKLANLTKREFAIPDLMALNRKPTNRSRGIESTTILPITNETSENRRNGKIIDTVDRPVEFEKKQKSYPLPMLEESTSSQEVIVSSLVDQLLSDIYGCPRSERGRSESDSTASSYKPTPQHRYLRRARLHRKCKDELRVVLETLRQHVSHAGGLLVRQLRRRDYLVAKRDKQYDVITAHLQAYSAKRTEDTRMRFSLTPQPGESGFTQWLDAMKMVARLQGGIPPEFRKRLWLTLAERHLDQRRVDWKQAEKLCFNEWSNPDDEELGIQIVKDLHRTGCSLFCGAAGRDNQAVLRRVLLGFARWNKSVGYCQGLNVLAAFVLQVTDRAEASAVKVMIYLVEGVLPEGYFADNLRGLSIDMAVFRDLLRMRLPKLSRHLEALQSDAKDKATGSSYEPPLTNVFTMQWFLTLFCHCLPQEAVLRVWDLIFLEGDEVLLRTALAIWEGISDRIMTVTSADEFYSIMGVLTREMLEFTDVNNLIKTIVNMGPLYGVTDLREKHRYNITPWARRLSDDDDTDTEEEEKLAVAAAMFGVPHRFKKDRSHTSSHALQPIGPTNDRERIALDITTLKQQYAKLRERQRQAHIILSAACARQSMVPTSTSQAMNHLLVGKSALVSAKTRQLGPPPGAIPPKPRTPLINSPRVQVCRDKQAVTLHWKDTKKSKDIKGEPIVVDGGESTASAVNTPEPMSSTSISTKRISGADSDSDSTSTELCDEPDRLSDVDSEEPTSTSDCYVMATDDEKSSRPGSSPIVGGDLLHPSSDRQGTTKGDTTSQLLLLNLEGENDNDCHDLLGIEGTSSSIAKITDQIRRLSASDTIDPPSTGLAGTTEGSSVIVEADVHQESLKVVPVNNTCDDDVSISVDRVTESKSLIGDEREGASRMNYPVSGQSFQILDRYDFSSGGDTPSTLGKLQDGEGTLETKYQEEAGKDINNSLDLACLQGADNRGAIVKELPNVRVNDTAASRILISGPEKVKSETDTSRPLESLSHKDRSIAFSGFETHLIGLDSLEKNGVASTVSVVHECYKYEEDPVAPDSSVSHQPEIITDEPTFYPRSYVIGHLPISPATVNVKLNTATELVPSKANVGILDKDIRSPDGDVLINVDGTFRSATIGPELKTVTSPSAVLISDSSSDRCENIKSHENIQPISTGKAVAIDSKVPDTETSLETKKSSEVVGVLEYRVEKDQADNFKSHTELACVDGDINFSSLNSNAKKFIGKSEEGDCDPTTRNYASAKKPVSRLSDREVVLTDERKNSNSLSLIGISTTISSSRFSLDVTHHDSSSANIHDDKKRSPKTPESVKSFSSGETMGPDSKPSSLTISPRTPDRTDSRMIVSDKSEHSSVSSDSKTLTLRSLDSDEGSNRAKLDTKSNVTRPSFDKSSPSTPISSDSLKNKSEISPKFVISSSSESCSPGKAKSSERSFSSELQSPISANSIKYRTSYPDGPENLSESPMDICSAASPFYPIVNPNQKSPSPYNVAGKQRNNPDSTETSPEQKSTSSKEEANSTKYKTQTESIGASKLGQLLKSSRDKDDYDSARPFEKELADTLSILPSESLKTKNGRISSLHKLDLDAASYRKKNAVTEKLQEIEERYTETDTISPLPRNKYENRSAIDEKSGGFKGIGINGRDAKYLLGMHESMKPFERSCSSLENRLSEMKLSPSSGELGTNTHKKRSSDILEDLRHLEAKTSNDGTADTSMLTRKTGYDWEDLKSLEARRQDNFSDSASGFSRCRLEVPSINVFGETRKSYVVEPKIDLGEGVDSILKNYSRRKSNGEPDDDRDSKLGVWTKVKPRANRDNGRRSSDRALKIIQENSAILHKILTCQAKKRLPDLEEISKEITISPINEEISKIFSPILEKMGLNEHEINEELARINFQDFDQMTATSGSEFDAKINDELCKLSLIDDSEVVDHLDVDEVVERDYLDTREAFIDRQINEELSKLLANYEEASPVCIPSRDESSSCQNPSELEGLELSGISSNVFAYQSSSDSIETKSELGSIQDSSIPPEKYPQYCEDVMSFAQTPKYSIRGLSPRSDIDIYRELEKLDKISSGKIVPSASSTIQQKIISPMSYASPSYAEVRPSSLDYCTKPKKSFESSPMKSPYDTYKPYDFKSRISPRKTPSNPYSARSYEKAGMDASFNFHDNPTTPSRLYDVETSRSLLSKETLEFRVRYDDESSKQIRNDDLSLEPYQTNLRDLNRGASYYSDEAAISLKRLSADAERSLNQSVVSPLDYTYNPTDLYTRKYDTLSMKNYSYPETNPSDYDKPCYKPVKADEMRSYLPLRRKNSHSLSPNYQYADRDFTTGLNPYTSELSASLEEASKRPGSHPEFVENICVAKYTEVPSRDSISFRKASMTLGLNESTTSRTTLGMDATPSPRSLFSPFPVRNASRKPKELGLKLGLYSPSSPGSMQLKRS